jgi:hypothetical protein
LKNLKFTYKRITHKVGAKESVAAEEMKAIKEKLSTRHQDNRKDDLRTAQELAGLCPLHRLRVYRSQCT